MIQAASLSPAMPKPAQAPDTAVSDFDMFKHSIGAADPDLRILERFRSAPPMFRTPRNGGHRTRLSQDSKTKSSRDVEAFCNGFATTLHRRVMAARMPPGMPHLPIVVDPPTFQWRPAIGVDSQHPVCNP
jgi:hypothetical protein